MSFEQIPEKLYNEDTLVKITDFNIGNFGNFNSLNFANRDIPQRYFIAMVYSILNLPCFNCILDSVLVLQTISTS